ncbi:hypothetical protein T439DRAFT_354897 [Meredithblackwellia eburnea MCA 4105]
MSDFDSPTSPTSMLKTLDSPVVRDALPSEDLTVAVLFYNAFRNTWSHNWFSNSTSIPEYITVEQVPHLNKKQSSRLLLYTTLIRTVRISHGAVRVVASPLSGEIYGCALWSPPNHPLAKSLPALYKNGILKLIWKWGYRGSRTSSIEFDGTIQRLFNEVFKCRRRASRLTQQNLKGSTYLHMLAVDSDYQGKGLGGTLVLDGLDVYGKDSLVLADTTDEVARRLLEGLGFDCAGDSVIGVGQCDTEGLRSKGPMSGGGPVYLMLYDSKRK